MRIRIDYRPNSVQDFYVMWLRVRQLIQMLVGIKISIDKDPACCHAGAGKSGYFEGNGN